MRIRTLLTALTLAATTAPGGAQQLTFDTASVRPNTSGEQRISMGTRGRTYTATNAPLRMIIANAFEIPGQDFRLDAPGWTNERFDITATIPEQATPRDTPALLRALLAERFKLVVRTETRNAQAFALVASGADKRLGATIRPAKADCEADPSIRNDRDLCQSQVTNDIVGRGQRISSLATLVQFFIRRPVVDRTGIAGAFDFDIEIPAQTGGLAGDAGGGLFTALPEQTGLKLESIQLPMEFVVVVSVERPIEN